MQELLVNELQSLMDAENQLTGALSKMQIAASSQDLKTTFKKHLSETQQHAKRLEILLEDLEAKTKAVSCKAMIGMIADVEGIIESESSAALKDAALISAAQKIEHYEIAGYGTAKAHAKLLELDEMANVLQEILKEEADVNKKLTKIAEGSIFASGINKQAAK